MIKACPLEHRWPAGQWQAHPFGRSPPSISRRLGAQGGSVIFRPPALHRGLSLLSQQGRAPDALDVVTAAQNHILACSVLSKHARRGWQREMSLLSSASFGIGAQSFFLPAMP